MPISRMLQKRTFMMNETETMIYLFLTNNYLLINYWPVESRNDISKIDFLIKYKFIGFLLPLGWPSNKENYAARVFASNSIFIL